MTEQEFFNQRKEERRDRIRVRAIIRHNWAAANLECGSLDDFNAYFDKKMAQPIRAKSNFSGAAQSKPTPESVLQFLKGHVYLLSPAELQLGINIFREQAKLVLPKHKAAADKEAHALVILEELIK